MELLYIWINYTNNGIFHGQDVCITNDYNIKFNFESHNLEVIPNEYNYNLFQNEVITNVTAIVGTNGSGKTTLLNYIFSNNIIPINKENRAEYTDITQGNHQISVQVFKNNDQVIAFHNLEFDIIVPKNIKVIRVDNITLNRMREERSFLNSVTKIYLTNSNYIPDSQGVAYEDKEPRNIELTIRSLKIFCKEFYRKSVRFPEGMLIKDNIFNGLQDMVIQEKTQMDFQEICDVIYFDYLFKKKRLKDFAGKISTRLLLSSHLLKDILYKKRDKQPQTYTSNNNYNEIVNSKVQLWNKYIMHNKCNIHDLNVRMKLNFIFEIDFIFNIIKQAHINNLTGENSLFEYCWYFLHSELTLENKSISDYYLKAFDEITHLEKILSSFSQRNNLSPVCDAKEIIEVDYEHDKNSYLKFINFISLVTRAPYSFILKYLDIGNLKMSSGERAYLNLFSWLNLIHFFNQIVPQIINSTRKNILLLIDEIDLYCHPDWQCKFIKYLLDELTEQFPENKIQIIFATHSPIVLSDIPLANTVYIKRKTDGISIIDPRDAHKETFASNIYQLFNDAFFLNEKGVIGEYAKSRINSVISKIKNTGEIDRKDENILAIIETIGEPVIRKKLMNMYNKKLSDYNRVRIATDYKQEKNIERQKLLNLRTRLENMIEEINDSLD